MSGANPCRPASLATWWIAAATISRSPRATPTASTPSATACCASRPRLAPPALIATTRNRPGLADTTSMAWVPMEPVDPRMAMLRGEVTAPLSATIVNLRRAIPAAGPAALLDEDPLVDQLLLDPSAFGVEPCLLEGLLELKVHLVHAASVLLDAQDHPVVETLGAGQVVHQVMAGNRVELVVHDQHDIGWDGNGL